jgi:hypothetical protein
VLYCAYNILQ